MAGCLLVWAFWILLLGFYMTSFADEGAYFLQASRLAAGEWPVRDFFTLHMIWAYLPFALPLRAMSTSLEAARLFSVLALVAISVGSVWLARRRYGFEPAAIVFVLLGFCWVWIYRNIPVTHASPSNFGLFVAFALLFVPSGRRWIPALVSGLGAGIMVNCRVVLVPVAVLLLVFWAIDGRSDRKPISAPLAFVAGGVLASLPSLAILAADRDAFFFNYLFARLGYSEAVDYRPPAGDWIGWIRWLIETRILSFPLFFAGWGRDGWGQNYLMLLPLAPLLASPFIRNPADGRTVAGVLWRDPLFRRSVLVCLAIYLCYAVSDRYKPAYLSHLMPFIALTAAAIHRAPVLAGTAPWPRWWRGILALGLTVHGAYFLAVSGVELVRRGEPGIMRPITIAAAACWVERNMPADVEIVNFHGAPVAAAGRQVPRGLEQGAGGVGLALGGKQSDEAQRRFKLLPAADLRAGLLAGRYPLVIEDDVGSTARRAGYLEDLPEILARSYRLAATTGGVYPFEFFLLKSDPSWPRRPAEPEILVTDHALRLSLASFRNHYTAKAWGNMVSDALADVRQSFSHLPEDIKFSMLRLVGAKPYPSCHGMIGPAVASGDKS